MANYTHDAELGRYQVEVSDGLWAMLDYRDDDGCLVISHTFVPPELRGQGCGTILMETVLAAIEAEGRKIRPVCSYAVVYLQRNPQWQHLIT